MDIFNNPCLTAIIDDAISCGAKTFSDLTDYERDKLTAICIEIMGCDAFDAMCSEQALHHLSSYLRFGKKEYALDLAETLAKFANDFFEYEIQKAFDRCIETRECETKIEAGLRPHIDFANGEIRWY